MIIDRPPVFYWVRLLLLDSLIFLNISFQIYVDMLRQEREEEEGKGRGLNSKSVLLFLGSRIEGMKERVKEAGKRTW